MRVFSTLKHNLKLQLSIKIATAAALDWLPRLGPQEGKSNTPLTPPDSRARNLTNGLELIAG